ncbi:MAG: hypothetical protein H6623_03020 [Bdellovibrionaceae bacterium]|nr:hypothetical protein [Pseudobdellovibrionaceae bacterium]
MNVRAKLILFALLTVSVLGVFTLFYSKKWYSQNSPQSITSTETNGSNTPAGTSKELGHRLQIEETRLNSLRNDLKITEGDQSKDLSKKDHLDKIDKQLQEIDQQLIQTQESFPTLNEKKWALNRKEQVLQNNIHIAQAKETLAIDTEIFTLTKKLRATTGKFLETAKENDPSLIFALRSPEVRKLRNQISDLQLKKQKIATETNIQRLESNNRLLNIEEQIQNEFSQLSETQKHLTQQKNDLLISRNYWQQENSNAPEYDAKKLARIVELQKKIDEQQKRVSQLRTQVHSKRQ